MNDNSEMNDNDKVNPKPLGVYLDMMFAPLCNIQGLSVLLSVSNFILIGKKGGG